MLNFYTTNYTTATFNLKFPCGTLKPMIESQLNPDDSIWTTEVHENISQKIVYFYNIYSYSTNWHNRAAVVTLPL